MVAIGRQNRGKRWGKKGPRALEVVRNYYLSMDKVDGAGGRVGEVGGRSLFCDSHILANVAKSWKQ